MPGWKRTFPAVPGALGSLRGEVASIAHRCGLSDQRVNEVVLAVTEAATNAVKHAYPSDAPGQVSASAEIDQGLLQIVIADHGQGMGRRSVSPGLGLGLPLIAALADAVDVVAVDPGTEIRMRFRCPAATSPRR